MTTYDSRSSRQCILLACSTLFMLLLLEPAAHAQLFGERRVGAPLRPGGSAAAEQNPGNLTGSERFLRGNRSRRDFVGSDRNEADGFVGASQAIGVGRVPAATESLRMETTNTARINRPLPPLPAKGMYYPRLEVDFEIVPRSESEMVSVATERLQKRVEQVAGSGVRMVVQGRTARLQGTASSSEAAELAAIMASFEPGIDRVENLITIQRDGGL